MVIIESKKVTTHPIQPHLFAIPQQPLPRIFSTHLSSLLVNSHQLLLSASFITFPITFFSHPPITGMAQIGPATISFPSSELPKYINQTEKGQYRKPPVDLEKCKLMEMTQYRCDVQGRDKKTSVTVCKPMLRLFRRCVVVW